MLGIEPEELVQRPLEYFIRSSKGGRSEDRDFVAKRAARYEKNRQAQLRNARAQRRELIEAQLGGIHGSMSLRTRSYCRSPVGAARLGFAAATSCSSSQHEFTVIEREKRELERIQQRQALEMQQMLHFELKTAELHAEREKKERDEKSSLLRNERAGSEKLTSSAARRNSTRQSSIAWRSNSLGNRRKSSRRRLYAVSSA